MFQYQSFNYSKSAAGKRKVRSHPDRDSIASYICLVKRREIGPTARESEIMEPAILENSRYEDDSSVIAVLRRFWSLSTFFSGI